ncbi:MAG: acetate--CoA ligase family protein [Candidatus Odinarchaeota archaeon]|nr:acetate--CoA ligase family protein [Candidatus Odinarchaeota archaeon]
MEEKLMAKSAIDKLFNPKSVAVVGASRHSGKIGHAVLYNLVYGGYRGKIYPINPNANEVLGLQCYPSVLKVPEEIDLAVITVPSVLVPQVMEEIGQKNISTSIVISSGFKEVGGEGAKLEREIVEIAKKYGIRFLGPNCFGVIDTWNSLNTTFSSQSPLKGHIAFISQSGALCVAILNQGLMEKIGFSKFINLGNKADIDEIDLMEYLADDPQTKVITLYLEDIRQGRKFVRTARKVVKKKPVLVIKAGRTEEGEKAVSSHTGSLAGMDVAYETAFKQSGVIRAYRIDELFDAAEAFANQPIPKSEKVAIITNGGGVGVLLTDAASLNGLKFARFSQKTIEELHKFLPPFASFRNPLDVTGNANEEVYFNAFKTIINDPNVDGVITASLPLQIMDERKLAHLIGEVATQVKKPVIGCFMGGEEVEEVEDILRKYNIPNYTEPERAVKAYAKLVRYKKILEELNMEENVVTFDVNRKGVAEIFKKLREENRTRLTEIEAKQVLENYGIIVPKYRVVKSLEEAVEAAEDIGYPVVLKIVSPDIIHKSDIGAVKINIIDEKKLRVAYQEIIRNVKKHAPKAVVHGISVQEMVPSGIEVIIGGIKDPQFGPLVMFGLGGIYVEIFRDVAFRVTPVSEREAEKMISEIRGYNIIRGVRGRTRGDINFIKETIMRVSQLLEDFKEISELDINPLTVHEKGGFAVDARMKIKY